MSRAHMCVGVILGRKVGSVTNVILSDPAVRGMCEGWPFSVCPFFFFPMCVRWEHLCEGVVVGVTGVFASLLPDGFANVA